MSLADEYRRQYRWRDWPRLYEALPSLEGRTVLDLGCAVGDQAADLVALGARVIGIDWNEDLLNEARSRNLAGAEFRVGDLRAVHDLGFLADGLWCGFVAAYFPDLPSTLAMWGNHLRPGGWIAITEIDDLFGHEPLGAKPRSLLEGYARESREAGRYDFRMGRKLRSGLERAGFAVSNAMTLADREFSLDGPAAPDVLEGWRTRFERMRLLQDYCGPDFVRVRDEFLECLTRDDHRSVATVCAFAATRGGNRT